MRHPSPLMASLMLLGGPIAEAQQLKPDPIIARYADTTFSARLPGGRTINMVCQGQGAPTVILSAGAADWGVVWGKVQGEIAKQSRVCTWDRAGFGFSSSSPAPQTLTESTSDLERALRANNINGPFVLVGHSVGALETLLLADRNKTVIAGIVLVDPTIPDQTARLARVAPEAARVSDAFLKKFVSDRLACADRLQREPGRASPCTLYGGEVPPSVSNALYLLDSDPARMRTTASFMANVAGASELAVNRQRNYGGIPLIVLSASNSFSAPEGATRAAREEVAREQRELERGHVKLAALSRHGEREIVKGAGHYLQLEQPAIVADAVVRVITRARDRK